jgi:hypothetical protein
MTALLIGPAERAALERLRAVANEHPVDMSTLPARLAQPEGKTIHMAQMNAQTISLPVGYLLTFSIETGHPGGLARHMSLSVSRPGRLPNHAAVWMVAAELGFERGLDDCVCWIEDLKGHGQAVNVVQLLEAKRGG